MNVTIGISKVRPNYSEWLKSGDSSIELIDLSLASDPIAALNQCDALVLTGGVDIHPKRYGHDDEISLCGEIDEQRDALELSLIEHAQQLQMPVRMRKSAGGRRPWPKSIAQKLSSSVTSVMSSGHL